MVKEIRHKWWHNNRLIEAVFLDLIVTLEAILQVYLRVAPNL